MPRGKLGEGSVFLTAGSPQAYSNLTPTSAEDESSNVGLWVVSIAAGVVAAGPRSVRRGSGTHRRPLRGGG